MDSRDNPNLLWSNTDKNKNKKYEDWKPENKKGKIEKSSDKALNNAETAALIAYPFVSGLIVETLKNDLGRMFAPITVPLLPVAFALDVVKAPFCLIVAAEEGIRGGATKLVSLFEKNGEDQERKRILNSFIERMKQTANILIQLGLEKEDELNEKCQSGDIVELVGLTLLNTAYASRFYKPGLLLASNKTLERNDCPAEGFAVFDAIMSLKDTIRKALDVKDMQHEWDEKKHAAIVCDWLKLIKNGKRVSLIDKPEATKEQIATINKLLDQMDKIRVLGMPLFPKKSEEIGKSVFGLRK